MDMNSGIVIKITIQLDERGQIRVQSSTPDKIVTFGLLEAAKFAIAGGMKESKIMIPEPVIIPFPEKKS